MAMQLVVQQLEQGAESYRTAAAQLQQVVAAENDFLGHLVQAEAVQWNSPAGVAYRAVLGQLRPPVKHIRIEAAWLAHQALIIGAELEDLAQRTKRLMAVMAAVGSVDFATLFSDAAEARAAQHAMSLAINASQRMESVVGFLEEHAGQAPWILRDAMSRMG